MKSIEMTPHRIKRLHRYFLCDYNKDASFSVMGRGMDPSGRVFIKWLEENWDNLPPEEEIRRKIQEYYNETQEMAERFRKRWNR